MDYIESCHHEVLQKYDTGRAAWFCTQVFAAGTARPEPVVYTALGGDLQLQIYEMKARGLRGVIVLISQFTPHMTGWRGPG